MRELRQPVFPAFAMFYLRFPSLPLRYDSTCLHPPEQSDIIIKRNVERFPRVLVRTILRAKLYGYSRHFSTIHVAR